jgi:hypothetical protein
VAADPQQQQQAPRHLLLGRGYDFTVHITTHTWTASEQYDTDQEWNKPSKNNMHHR